MNLDHFGMDTITLAGPLEAKLFVSTTGTDADFVVTDWRDFANQVAAFSEQQF